MATFLLQKFPHPVTAGTEQACALLAPYDVIAVRDDAWVWGNEELTHPWFRLIRWSTVTLAQGQALVSSEPATIDAKGTPMTFRRARSTFFNLDHPKIPAAVMTWWRDNARAAPMFSIPPAFTAITIADITVARGKVSRPDYTPPANPTGITP